MGWRDRVEFSSLAGKTLERVEGAEVGSEQIDFFTTDGERFTMFHEQDCCEFVRLEDVCGDVSALVGEKILDAYEESNADYTEPEYPDSYTWTFYTIRTMHATVTLRWLGESNGYYSESVDFELVPKPELQA